MVAVDPSVIGIPPFVLDVLGEVANNGDAVGLRVQRSAQSPVDLCLRIEDVQHLIGILLALSCEAKRRQPTLLGIRLFTGVCHVTRVCHE